MNDEGSRDERYTIPTSDLLLPSPFGRGSGQPDSMVRTCVLSAIPIAIISEVYRVSTTVNIDGARPGCKCLPEKELRAVGLCRRRN